MIRKASEITASTVEGFKGGKGALISRDIRSAEELAPHGRKFGYSILPPGASIGDHTHTGDSETYFFLKGKGRYNDNGTIVEVGPGDMTFCADGETHGVESIGTEPLEFIALILFTVK
jgi:mannose-6-phosphate isomerase-like protein (cupin superfamily)